MKKLRLGAAVMAVLLIFSMGGLAVFVGKYIDRCRVDSYQTVRIASTFTSMYEKVTAMVEDGRVDEGDLRWLQQQAAVALYVFSNFPVKHDMWPNEDCDHSLTYKLIDLQDIVFKIHDGEHIPAHIFQALDRNGLVPFLEEMSRVSGEWLETHEEVGPFDGNALYEELRRVCAE